VSKIYQVDLFKNGKMQYAFASSHKIYVLDRLGRDSGKFPIRILGLEHFSVIDYDKSKNYRFVGVDQEGGIYFYSKFGTGLAGWQPKKLGTALSGAITHVRTGSQDFILAIQQDGLVNNFNREANAYKGFPLDFEARIINSPYVQYGGSPELTTIFVLSEKGELMSFNLAGKILRREQVLPSDTESRFQFCLDEIEGEDWVIVRHNPNLLTLVGKNGKLWFEKDYNLPILAAQNTEEANNKVKKKVAPKKIVATEKIVQYFNFGAEIQLIAITDPDLHKTWLHYANGDWLLENPLDSDQAVMIQYSETDEAFYVYKSFKTKFEKVKIASR